jgi:prefoldin subunit 5
VVGEGQRIDRALRWLRSHLKRLELERKSFENKLAELTAEIERVAAEIETAEERRRRLPKE